MSWHERAACLGVDTEIFYAHEEAKNATIRRREARDAMRTCEACPVSQDCLTAALDEPAQHGIRGGTYAKTRRRMVLMSKEKAA